MRVRLHHSIPVLAHGRREHFLGVENVRRLDDHLRMGLTEVLDQIGQVASTVV